MYLGSKIFVSCVCMPVKIISGNFIISFFIFYIEFKLLCRPVITIFEYL